MTFWIIQSTIISIILIFLVHYLFVFFRDTLTVPKIKDLVNKPNKKYDEILSTVHVTKSKFNKKSEKTPDIITSETKVNMKTQLHSFLNDLKKKNSAGEPSNFSLYK